MSKLEVLTGRKDGKTRRNAVKHNKEYATEVALNGIHRERFETRLRITRSSATPVAAQHTGTLVGGVW